MTMAFVGIFLIAFLAVLLGLGGYWAWRSVAGRWVMGAVGVLAVLFYMLIAVRTIEVRNSREVAAIVAENGLEAWRRAEGMGPAEVVAPGPRPAWVDDAGGSGRMAGSNMNARFEIRTPGPDGSLVGYSELRETGEAAIAQAKEALQDQVRALLEWQLSKEGRLDALYGAGAEAARQALESAAENLAAQAENFAEAKKLPASGQIAHRAAVRARVPLSRVEETARQVLGQVQVLQAHAGARRMDILWTLVSIAGLGIFIVILYTFVNAGTKGHMAWPLRIASVAAFIFLCLGLLALRGHLL